MRENNHCCGGRGISDTLYILPRTTVLTLTVFSIDQFVLSVISAGGLLLGFPWRHLLPLYQQYSQHWIMVLFFFSINLKNGFPTSAKRSRLRKYRRTRIHESWFPLSSSTGTRPYQWLPNCFSRGKNESPISRVYIIVYFIVDHFAYTYYASCDSCRTRINAFSSQNPREENSQPIMYFLHPFFWEVYRKISYMRLAIPFSARLQIFCFTGKIGWARDTRKQWLYEIPPTSFWMISRGTHTGRFFLLTSESNSIRKFSHCNPRTRGECSVRGH